MKAVAQVKFALIAPVVTSTFNDSSATTYFKRVAENEIDWPDGTKKKVSWKTIKWWYHLYV